MWIEFSDLDPKLLFLLIFPVFKRIQDVTKKFCFTSDNFMFQTFRYFLNYTFAFIPLLILKCRTKNEKEITEEEKKIKEENEKIKNKLLPSPTIVSKNKEIKKRKYFSILYFGLVCFFGISFYMFRKYFEKQEHKDVTQTIGIFFEIFSFVVLSYLLLKQKLFKHHFIFIGIMATILLISFCISIPYIKKGYILKSIGYYFVYSILFALFAIVGKSYMLKFYENPYFFLLTMGIINSTLLLIYDAFAYFFGGEKRDKISGIIIGFQDNFHSVGDVFKLILELFVQSLTSFGMWLTIYYFTPCHYFISEYIAEYILFIVTAVNNYGDKDLYSTANIVIYSIVSFINIFCALFFNEVLILNICNLDYNTKKRITERMQLEEKSYDINKIIEMEDNPVNEDNGENGDNNENRENKEKNERCSDASYTY